MDRRKAKRALCFVGKITGIGGGFSRHHILPENADGFGEMRIEKGEEDSIKDSRGVKKNVQDRHKVILFRDTGPRLGKQLRRKGQEDLGKEKA